MNTSVTILLTSMAAVLVLFSKTTFACGGHKLEIEYIRNCESDNVIEFSKNFTVIMNENCELHLSGCITAHADITSAEIDYNVEKDILKRSGKKDVCSHLEKKSHDIEMGLDLLGLPKECPIHKGTLCMGHKSIDVSKYKLRMNILAGRLKGKALLTASSGKSCMEFSAKLNSAIGRVLPSIGQVMMGSIDYNGVPKFDFVVLRTSSRL